jgi:glycosyltransferase involved in cell wall biosynthesis
VALRPVGTNTLKQRNAMGTRGTVLSADLKDMKAPDGTGVFVTVLICTRDRAETLERTLESLLCPANLKVERWDIVVVDNGSRDHTAHVCQAFRERFPDHFSFCIEKRPGKSNALNTGVAVAKGDVIAFTDDDVTCAPDYLQAIRTVFNQYPVDAVQGRIVLECEGGHPVWLDRLLGLTVGWREDATEFTDLQGTLCGRRHRLRGRDRTHSPDAQCWISARIRSADFGVASFTQEAADTVFHPPSILSAGSSACLL